MVVNYVGFMPDLVASLVDFCDRINAFEVEECHR